MVWLTDLIHLCQARTLSVDFCCSSLAQERRWPKPSNSSSHLRPETAALIGSSGVGKSTIVNRLLGECRQATREVRQDDDRGRHTTTTTRSMFFMPGRWLLIDMPGLREVQLWTSPDQLDASFGDVSELAAGCRFRDCTHTGEPGCAIMAGGIDEGRLNNYRKMQRELDYVERKADKRLVSETRARSKAIHKAMRNHPKEKW